MRLSIVFYESGELCGLRKVNDEVVLQIDNAAPFSVFWLLEGSKRQKLLSCPGDYAEAILDDGVVVQESPEAPCYISKYEKNFAPEQFENQVVLGELGFIFDEHFITLIKDDNYNNVLTSTNLCTGQQSVTPNNYFRKLIIDNTLLFRMKTYVVSLSAELEELWRFEIPKEYYFRFPNSNYLVNTLKKGIQLVIFVAGYSKAENETLLVALEPETGEKVWSKPIKGMAESFSVSNGKCFLALDGRFYVLDEATGDILLAKDIDLKGSFLMQPVDKYLLFIADKPAVVYLYSEGGDVLLDEVTIENGYSFDVNSEIVVVGNQLYISTSSSRRHLGLALNGYAVISLLEETGSAIVSMQERPMTITTSGKAKDKEYILDFSHSSKDDLVRYMQIGIREIACRFGQGDIYISPEIDEEHTGKIVVRYAPSELDADIEGELDDIAKSLMSFIEDEICYFPGASSKQDYHWSIRFERK